MKGNVYLVSEVATVSRYGIRIHGVYCEDEEDIVISGGCQMAGRGVLWQSRPLLNANPSEEAGWRCTVKNLNDDAFDFTVRAFCLDMN